ncbi:hypothetical protein C8Q79DRAFT_1062206 [Trametes meyenii]|nr:hypothetical protein C8Q79DRAFT_1062206 [Trametes meyenii]
MPATRRGRRAGEAKVPCSVCGLEFKPAGLAAHTRACAKKAEIAEGRARLAQSVAVAASTSTSQHAGVAPPVATLPWARPYVPVPIHPQQMPSAFATGFPDVHLADNAPPPDDAASESSLDEPPHEVEHGVRADNRPESPESSDDGLLEAVFEFSTVHAQPRSTLHLPTFKQPVLQNPPADLCADDFLAVHHPHSERPPTTHHFEDFSREPPKPDPSKLSNRPWEPFQSQLDFEFAEFALNAALNQGQIDILLKLVDRITVNRMDFSFRSYGDVKGAWEAASHMSPDYDEHELKVGYKNETRTFKMFCRPLFEWSLSLVADPILAPKFTWHAQRLFKLNGETQTWERFVDEPYTADNWWDAESRLPNYASPLAYSVYADKTRLSSFGSQKGYPIIARILNLPSNVRNGDGYGGGQVVGFLPIVEDENEEGKKGFTTFKRAVWHKAFWILLESVAKWAKDGYNFQCGDGVWRILFPMILILVADYEEQAMMSLIRGPKGKCPCPVCLVPQDQQTNLGEVPLYPYRDPAVAQALVEDPTLKGEEREKKFKSLGLRPLENVFWKIPGCDVYRALSWDRLHAYHGGLFSDHLFDEFQEIVQELGRDILLQINAQIDAMPSFSGLNHFSAAGSVKFADGKKYQHIAKIIVQAIYNLLSLATTKRGYLLLKCIRRYVILDMLSGLKVHLEVTIRMFSSGLVRYKEAIQEYSEVHPEKSWNFPKNHSHQHLPSDIVGKGASKGYNSKNSEKMHGILKEIYSEQTNFKDIDAQISRIEHHRSIAKITRARIEAYEDSLPKGEKPAKEDPFQFNQIHLGARLHPVTLEKIEQRQTHDKDFTRFRLNLEEYLNSRYSNTRSHHAYLRLKPHQLVIESRYLRVDYESVVTWKQDTDHIRCSPLFQGTPRYDSVIYRVDDNTYGFAQLKCVFTFEFRGIHYPIALIRPFEVVQLPRLVRSRTDQDLGLCRLRKKQGTSLIPADSITRAALITKDFGRNGDFLAIDTVDEDMFMRFRRDFPIWDT